MVYQGSKNRISKYIVPMIQKAIDQNPGVCFIDAFVGGGNIIDKIKCGKKIGYDLNPYLIALLNNVDKVEQVDVPISREEYSRCKEIWKQHPDGDVEDSWYISAIGFIASFGGKFFNGSYAKNEYVGYPTRSLHDERKRNLLRQAPNLKDCVFEVKNFFSLDCENCVIYCDPPYNNKTKYPYDDYDKEKFWNKVRELSKKNIIFISELEAPDDFVEIWRREIKNTVGLSNSISQVEKLFVPKEQIND